MSIECRIAIGVGTRFAIVSSHNVGHIALKNTNTLIKVDDETFPLHKGKTFEESCKVDDYFDTHSVKEMNIREHLVNQEEETEWDVTITRFGCVKIKANSREEAMKKANSLPTSEITWNEDWSATDAYN